jgi:hypothetical protein
MNAGVNIGHEILKIQMIRHNKLKKRWFLINVFFITLYLQENLKFPFCHFTYLFFKFIFLLMGYFLHFLQFIHIFCADDFYCEIWAGIHFH